MDKRLPVVMLTLAMIVHVSFASLGTGRIRIESGTFGNI